ncbi:MAG: phosphotransferase family protein [Acidobacteriota bacterium]
MSEALTPRHTPDTRPVRPSEQLDWTALDSYVRARFETVEVAGRDKSATLEVEQFHGGHSNLTYLLRYGAHEMVLRRAPFGLVPARAHDMAREYRTLAALHPVFPLCPRPLLLCEDPAILGAVFYVMERRSGVIIRDQEPPSFQQHPELRRQVSAALIDALAALHALDVAAPPIRDLGKPEGFVQRQVRGWTERWNKSQTCPLPAMDRLADWLGAQIPADPAFPSILHGDFKLDNVMLDAADPARLVAVFDWEMSAIGDARVDLGILLCYWVHSAAVVADRALASVTTRPGWFSRQEILERYESRNEEPIGELTFFEALAIFKLAVIIQQLFARYHRGQTDDPRFASLGGLVAQLAERGEEIAGR